MEERVLIKFVPLVKSIGLFVQLQGNTSKLYKTKSENFVYHFVLDSAGCLTYDWQNLSGTLAMASEKREWDKFLYSPFGTEYYWIESKEPGKIHQTNHKIIHKLYLVSKYWRRSNIQIKTMFITYNKMITNRETRSLCKIAH